MSCLLAQDMIWRSISLRLDLSSALPKRLDLSPSSPFKPNKKCKPKSTNGPIF